MNRLTRSLSLACLLAASLSPSAPAQSEPPAVDGSITALTSPSDFFVDGKHVLTNPQTAFSKPTLINGQTGSITDPTIAKTLAIGDHVQVFGSNDRHLHAIVATSVNLQPLTHDRIGGFAVIQKIIATSPQLILEADGYRIAIPANILRRKSPLTDQTPPAANQWITYSGRWNDAGLILAEHAELSSFALDARLKKALDKSKETLVAPIYRTRPGDPDQDGKLTAPYLYADKHTVTIPNDRDIQHRLQTIGDRLIPASQKALPNDDPQKIHFQFYVVDGMTTPLPMGSPDGTVVMPIATLGALQNDDQVAAILSGAVAQALEWQVPAAATGNAGPAMLAAGEMPMVGPILSIALISGGLYESKHGTYAVRFDPLQSIRVGLSLVHDAGFDIHQAPVAWQTLRYGKATQASKPPTQQSAYLLNLIGLEYTHTDTPTPPTSPSPAQ